MRRRCCWRRPGRYADRVSVNIELPTPADLHRLAPDKSHTAIVGAMTELRAGIDEAKAGKRERRKAAGVRARPASRRR